MADGMYENGKCTNCGDLEPGDSVDIGIDRESFAELTQKVNEIHAFAKQLAEVLDAVSKNPMLGAMLPRM